MTIWSAGSACVVSAVVPRPGFVIGEDSKRASAMSAKNDTHETAGMQFNGAIGNLRDRILTSKTQLVSQRLLISRGPLGSLKVKVTSRANAGGLL